MSRIGKKHIVIPAGVTVDINKNVITVSGPLGTLKRTINRALKVKTENNEIIIERPDDLPETKAQHGLYRQLINNMIVGASKGFTRALVVNGVGYKLTQNGENISIDVGFSHPIAFNAVPGIKLAAKGVDITVSGADKELVGQVAAKIRAIRPVEPYHAYGIRYSDEVVIKKQGKASGKATGKK